MQIADVFTLNNASLVRLVIYTALLCFSIFIIVGVAIVKSEFGDQCILFLKLKQVSLCNYPMVVAIIFQLWYSLNRLVYLVLYKIGKLPPPLSNYFYRGEFIFLCIDALSLLLTFVSAIILSAGYHDVCSYFNSLCGKQRWAHAARAAQAGAWISIILWVALIAMCAVTLWRAGLMPWMNKRAQPSTSSHPEPQISTTAADMYQPNLPGNTFDVPIENPYEPNF